MHQRVEGADQDTIETMMECPVCTSCPACKDERHVTAAQRNDYLASLRVAKEPCPRCAAHGRSAICAMCQGSYAVAPGVAALWQMHNPNQRRASRPEMPAIILDPRRDE